MYELDAEKVDLRRTIASQSMNAFYSFNCPPLSSVKFAAKAEMC